LAIASSHQQQASKPGSRLAAGRLKRKIAECQSELPASVPQGRNQSIFWSEDGCMVMFLKKHALCADHNFAGKQSGAN
jgi:hypothetical protein